MKIRFSSALIKRHFSFSRATSGTQIERAYQVRGALERQISARILRTNTTAQLLYMYSQLTRSIDYNVVHLVLLFGRLLEHEVSRVDQVGVSTVTPLNQKPIFFKLLGSLEKSVPRLRPAFLPYLLKKIAQAVHMRIGVAELLDSVVGHLRVDKNFNFLDADQLLSSFGELAQLSQAFPQCMGLDTLLFEMQATLIENASQRHYSVAQLFTLAKWLNLLATTDAKLISRLNRHILGHKSLPTLGLYSWYFLNRQIPKNGPVVVKILELILDRKAYNHWSVAQCSRFLSALITETTRAEILILTLENNCLKRLVYLLEQMLKAETGVEGLHLLAEYLLNAGRSFPPLHAVLASIVSKNIPEKGEEYALLLYLLKHNFCINEETVLRVIEKGKTSFLSLRTLLDLNDALHSWDQSSLEPLHQKIIKVFIKRSSTVNGSIEDTLKRVVSLPWTPHLRSWLMETIQKNLIRMCLITGDSTLKEDLDFGDRIYRACLQVVHIMYLMTKVMDKQDDLDELCKLFESRMLIRGIKDEVGNILLRIVEGPNSSLALTAQTILNRAAGIKLN